jgi:hypothetical protein
MQIRNATYDRQLDLLDSFCKKPMLRVRDQKPDGC